MLVDITDEMRAKGVIDELNFWRGYVGSPEFAERFAGPHRNVYLQLEIETFIRGLRAGIGRPLRLLDLGSGPASMLSHNFSKDEVILTAGDALATQYEELMRDHPMRGRYVAPVEAQGERLAASFPAHEFDVVHIRNALDHVLNPMTTIYSMMTVLKPGGHMIIHGAENEANNAGWGGFHQWNLRFSGGLFVIEGANRKPFAVEEFFKGAIQPVAKWMTNIDGRPWMHFIARVN